MLDDSNRPLTGVLPSITQMIELMTAPDEIREEVTAKIEAGEDVTVKEIQRLKKEGQHRSTGGTFGGICKNIISEIW